MGMLLVSGPTVFPGYLGYDGPSPFRELRRQALVRHRRPGRASTRTASSTSRGRLKRFLKAGGEMISLPALEEPFARLYPPTKDGPRVAVEGIETDGGRRIVLFTTEPIDLREANAQLLEEGFRGVMRLDEVRQGGQDPGPGHRQDRLQAAAGFAHGPCRGGGEETLMIMQRVDRKGRVNLGIHFAGRMLLVDDSNPERETWLYQNHQALSLVRAGLKEAQEGQFSKTPPDIVTDPDPAAGLID